MPIVFSRLERRYGDAQLLRIKKAVSREAAYRGALRARENTRARRDLEVTRKENVRIAVVGGGFAGLRAAHELRSFCDVTVFEANDRLGGRVHTIQIGGRTVEAGAELIGFNHHEWISLAKEFDLGLVTFNQDSYFDHLGFDSALVLNGKSISSRAQNTLYNEMAEAKHKIAELAQTIGDKKKPWRGKRAKKLDAQSLGSWIRKQKYSKRTKAALAFDFVNDGGRPVEDQSLLGILAVIRGHAEPSNPEAYFNMTEELRCSEGSSALAQRLEGSITSHGGDIRKGTPVRTIDIEAGLVRIGLADGKTFEADAVILAVPPSLWLGKDPAIQITPQPSEDYRITLGNALKYICPVSKRFWIDKKASPQAGSDAVGVTWEATDNQIAPPGFPIILSLFAGGKPADAVLKAYHENGIEGVRTFYGSRLEALLPGFQDNRLADDRFMAWPDERWTKAGYACPSPGEVTRAAPLLDKCFEQRLFFAGEHTCPRYYGFMEGALVSGASAGEKVKSLFK